MDICYLCGEEMIDREEYDADPTQFAVVPKLKHAEHIIQNALYGKLYSYLKDQCK
jgi:hypothetical protein